jgi:hypothetical protein
VEAKKAKRAKKEFLPPFALFAFFASLHSFQKPRRRRIRIGSVFASAPIAKDSA